MIWSKQINESNYSLCKTLQPFNDSRIWDLIFINEFNYLISCCSNECKIVIYKNKDKYEEFEHEKVRRLIPMSNGLLESGCGNKCLNIWSPCS